MFVLLLYIYSHIEFWSLLNGMELLRTLKTHTYAQSLLDERDLSFFCAILVPTACCVHLELAVQARDLTKQKSETRTGK